ncbi:MAG: hypothetical protein GYB55_23305 [Cytophagales bacterium]|nr:hypothetical protein [Cytophagales bacterium]
MKTAIVVVAFNRPNSLIKLLSSLEKAFYPSTDIPLIISIDYQNSAKHEDVVKIANDFIWKNGDKRVIEHKQNLGLRKHILSCGDLTEEFDSVIIIEDDLTLAPDFYTFANGAAEFYKDEDKVAGISLYSYEFEELGWFRFYPKRNQGDTFFMQWAGSWGQLWTKNNWQSFKNWYNKDIDILKINIPDHVKGWDRSWKKFYIAYLVETNRYYVYPYYSFSTVNDEQGTHYSENSRTNNVCLMRDNASSRFRYTEFLNCTTKYDSFFQPIAKEVFIENLNKVVEVEFDLFGTKKVKNFKSCYVFSIKPSKNTIMSFGNTLIPFDDYLFHNVEGDFFNLALKTDFSEINSVLDKGKKLYYTRKVFAIKEMVIVILYRVLSKLKFVK